MILETKKISCNICGSKHVAVDTTKEEVICRSCDGNISLPDEDVIKDVIREEEARQKREDENNKKQAEDAARQRKKRIRFRIRFVVMILIPLVMLVLGLSFGKRFPFSPLAIAIEGLLIVCFVAIVIFDREELFTKK